VIAPSTVSPVLFFRPEERGGRLAPVPRGLEVVGDELRCPRMQGQVAHLAAFAMHPQVQHPAPRVDVFDLERTEFLAPQSMVEQHREDGAVTSPFECLRPRRIE
jgi:hypothetical protein